MSTWTEALTDALLGAWSDALPPSALQAASRIVLDTVVCALGGREHSAATAVRRAVLPLGGAEQSTLIGEPTRSSSVNAVLINGAAIRALDCNDFDLADGKIMGHPSDNVAVALATAEACSASGTDLLRAVVLGYELYARLQRHIVKKPWDHTSASGFAAAAIAGLLLGLNRERLGNALSIGGAQSFSLGALRQGEISMLKAAANARTAADGTLAALLAAEGLSGPPELFEGRGGVCQTFSLDASSDLLARLTAVPERWNVERVSFKPYPAVGTSQGVIAATLGLGMRAPEVDRVVVSVPDSATTREHLADEARFNPTTRETADHSLPFLVAVALEDGDVGVRQFQDERWFRSSTRALMERVSVVPDASLNEHAKDQYPAVVTAGGTRSEMLQVPGSPSRPLSAEELSAKLRRVATSPPSSACIDALTHVCLTLAKQRNLSPLWSLLGKLA